MERSTRTFTSPSGETWTFVEEDWKTPNTYSRNYEYPPDGEGVYLLLSLYTDGIRTMWDDYEISYVGRSDRLCGRYSNGNHPVIRLLQDEGRYCRFYFQTYPECKYTERFLIETIRPRFNRQYNPAHNGTKVH